MTSKKTKQQEKDAALAKIKKAQANADAKGPPVNSMGQSASEKAPDQAGANAMNAAVEKDIAAQKEENDKEAEKAKAASDAKADEAPGLDEIEEELPADEVFPLTGEAMEEEIERRAEVRYQEKIAQTPPVAVAAQPVVADPNGHVNSCKKVTAAIDGILSHRHMMPDNRDGLNALFEMLETILLKMMASHKKAPDMKDFKAVNFGKILIDAGSDDRINQIYTNAIAGHCEIMLDAAENIDKNWHGPWIGGVKKLMKALV